MSRFTRYIFPFHKRKDLPAARMRVAVRARKTGSVRSTSHIQASLERQKLVSTLVSTCGIVST